MEIPQHKVFWYTLKPLEKIPPLMDDIMVDVAVIGGGMTGLSAVQRLREAGLSVALLEKEFCGAGASGKSSGFINPDSEFELGQFIRRFGPEKAKQLWEFGISGVELIRKNIRDFRIECDYQIQDSLFVANTTRAFADVEEGYEARRELGYASTLYQKDDVARVLGSAGYTGAVRYPSSFGIISYLYCRAMGALLRDKGVRIYEDTEVTEITSENVFTPRGKVRAGAVILATDRFTPELGKLSKTIYHAQTFLSISAPLSDTEAHAIFPQQPLMVWDSDLIYQYYRLIGGNRMLLGGGNMFSTYAKREALDIRGIARKLASYFEKKFPQVSIRWEYLWPGLIGITKDLLPVAGQDEKMPHVYYAGAGAGLPWSAACGRYIAEKIIAGRNDFDVFFSPSRRFFVPDSVQTVIGTKAAFGISNFRTEHY